MLVQEYLNQIFESKNWSFDTYQMWFFEYGPILIFALVTIIVGKFLFGKIRLQWSKFYLNKGITNRWTRFLSRNNHIKFLEVWRSFLSDRVNKHYFVFSFLMCFILGLMSAKMIAYNASAPGTILNDPIMDLFVVRDWSKIIFFLEYLSVIIMIFYVSDRPAYFVKCLWGVATLQVVRCIFIFLIPLAPPTDMIFLVDPFTQFFFGENVHVTNDLFFSGHVSLLALFYFIVQNKYLKVLLFTTASLVGIFLVWQHVHYSYDVLFAPVASFIIYKYVIAHNWNEAIINRYKKVLELKD